jgi:hypothetical protein
MESLIAEARRVQQVSADLHERTIQTLADAAETIAAVQQHEVGNRVAELVEEVRGLRLAMESRAEIEQAKGIVMATMRCSAEQAFDVLRSQSQHQNRRLREICQELVATTSRPVPATGSITTIAPSR